jgi:hypothetical protein
MPAQVEGIAIGRPVARIYVLHGTQWGTGDDGTLVAEYRIHYRDGSDADLPVVLGDDVRDWWNNPHPEKEVRSLDIATTAPGDQAPFCIAITVEEPAKAGAAGGK